MGQREHTMANIPISRESSSLVSKTGSTWRPSTSFQLPIIPNKDNYHLNTDMFAPPQHVKSSGSKVSPAAVSTPSTPAAAGNGDQQKARQLKPAATGSNKSNVNELISEWSGFPPPKDRLSFAHDETGIVAWSSRPPKRTEAQLLQEMMGENSDKKSWCSLCQPEFCGLSSYLKELKNKLKSRNTKSFSAGVIGSLRYSSSSSRPTTLSSAPSSQVRKQPNSKSSYSNNIGYLTSTQISQQPHIPCKNYNRLHKHRSFNDLQQCHKQAELDNKSANRESWHVSSALTQNHRVRRETPTQGYSSDSEVSRQLPTNQNQSFPTLLKSYQSCKTRLTKSSNDISPNVAKERNADDAVIAQSNAPSKASINNSNAKQSTSNSDSNSEAEDQNPQLDTTLNYSNKQDFEGEGGLFASVSQPDPQLTKQTMQEYVETYYNAPAARQALPARPTPPSRRSTTVSPYRKTLPSIVEKDQQKQEEQRLIENILNYRHVSSIKERETAHKNRYSALTATDIRRTTAQLLKTSLLRNTLRTPSTPSLTAALTRPLMTEARPETTAGPAVSLQAVNGPQAMPCRTEGPLKSTGITNSSFLQTRTQPLLTVDNAIPNVGIKWKIQRPDG